MKGEREKNTAGKPNWKDTQEDEEEDCRSARLQRSASNVSMLTFFFVFVHLSADEKTMLLCDDWIHSLIY